MPCYARIIDYSSVRKPLANICRVCVFYDIQSAWLNKLKQQSLALYLTRLVVASVVNYNIELQIMLDTPADYWRVVWSDSLNDIDSIAKIHVNANEPYLRVEVPPRKCTRSVKNSDLKNRLNADGVCDPVVEESKHVSRIFVRPSVTEKF